MRDERSAIVLRFFCALQFSVFSSVVAPICWLAECCYNVYIKVLLLKHLDTFGASESKIRLDAGRFFSFFLASLSFPFFCFMIQRVLEQQQHRFD